MGQDHIRYDILRRRLRGAFARCWPKFSATGHLPAITTFHYFLTVRPVSAISQHLKANIRNR